MTETVFWLLMVARSLHPKATRFILEIPPRKNSRAEMEMRRESSNLWRINKSKPPNMEEEKEVFEKLLK
jgi:hypothetical protein